MIAYACSLNSPILAKWDGSSWSSVAVPAKTVGSNQATLIDGSSDSNIWMAGDSAAEVWKYDGASWSLVATGLTATWTVRGLIVLSPTDVWISVRNAGGTSEGIYYYDGATWSLDYASAFYIQSSYATGTNKSDAFIMCGTHPTDDSYKYSGGWSKITSAAAGWMDGIFGISPTNVWSRDRSAGVTPNVYSFDGVSWTLQFSATNLVTTSLNVCGNKVYANPVTNEIWIVGDALGSVSTTLRYWYYDGLSWTNSNDGAIKTAGADLVNGGIHGDGSNVCMVGGTDAFFWNGSSFVLDTTGVTFNGVKDVWVVPTTAPDIVVVSCPYPSIGPDFTINNLNCMPSQFYDGAGNSLTIAPFSLNNPGISFRNRSTPLISSVQSKEVKHATLPKTKLSGSF